MEAQFRDLSACRQFIYRSTVAGGASWDFPVTQLASIEEDSLGQWIAGEVDLPDHPSDPHIERWVLFRSGQFVLNKALRDIPQLGNNLHILDAQRIIAQAFEFARRMGHERVLSPQGTIKIELHKVGGRGLFVPSCQESYWCKKDDVVIERQVCVEDLEPRSRDLALDVALDVYREFGCADAPRSLLAEDRQRLQF